MSKVSFEPLDLTRNVVRALSRRPAFAGLSVLFIIAATALAAYLPARRALSIPPSIAMRG